jgi:hypothetical protein
VVIFLPEGQTASLPTQALSSGLEGTFFSVTTGARSPASAQEVDEATRFDAPGAGDWLLILAPPAE